VRKFGSASESSAGTTYGPSLCTAQVRRVRDRPLLGDEGIPAAGVRQSCALRAAVSRCACTNRDSLYDATTPIRVRAKRRFTEVEGAARQGVGPSRSGSGIPADPSLSLAHAAGCGTRPRVNRDPDASLAAPRRGHTAPTPIRPLLSNVNMAALPRPPPRWAVTLPNAYRDRNIPQRALPQARGRR
jgi:hypothetical protein